MRYLKDEQKVSEDGYCVLPAASIGIPSLEMMGHFKKNASWSRLGNHYHRSMECVVVISGTQRYVVQEEEYLLHGGTMFITYPDELHGNDEMPQNACECIWFQLDIAKQEDFLGLSGKMAQCMHESVLNCHARTLQVTPKQMALLKDAWEAISSGRQAMYLQGYTAFLAFISSVFTGHGMVQNQKMSREISHAVHYMHEHLSTKMHVNEVAEACGLSESYFKARFREEMGIAPQRYMNTLRIEKAKMLIAKGESSMTEIAAMLDFETSAYFSSVFKRYTGFSPTMYQRLMHRQAQGMQEGEQN